MIDLEHQDSIAIMRIAHGRVNTLDTELLSEFIASSERRIPFNEDDIFRHYPELDT